MYLTGVVLFFILAMFFIAMIYNENLIEKYQWIENLNYIFEDMKEVYYATIFIAVLLWPLVVIIAFIIAFGYCLFKIFSKLIDYFVK
jgi:hypothetical protein